MSGSLALLFLRAINKIQSAHIFWYQMAVEIEGKTVLISQQLSEKQECCPFIIGCHAGPIWVIKHQMNVFLITQKH